MSNRITNIYIDPQIRAVLWDVLRVNIEHLNDMLIKDKHTPNQTIEAREYRQSMIDRYTDELIGLMN